jgi:hypothetical protein
MRTFVFALLSGIVGYAVGVGAGIMIVNVFSSNRFDRDMEAVMTGFFFFGPAGAIGAVILYFVVRALR